MILTPFALTFSRMWCRSPGSWKRRRCTLGSRRRGARPWACDTALPTLGRAPVTSRILDMPPLYNENHFHRNASFPTTGAVPSPVAARSGVHRPRRPDNAGGRVDRAGAWLRVVHPREDVEPDDVGQGGAVDRTAGAGRRDGLGFDHCRRRRSADRRGRHGVDLRSRTGSAWCTNAVCVTTCHRRRLTRLAVRDPQQQRAPRSRSRIVAALAEPPSTGGWRTLERRDDSSPHTSRHSIGAY
jgi:hypothetical protein